MPWSKSDGELKLEVTVLMGDEQISNCATRLVALGIKLQDAVCKRFANQKLQQSVAG